MRLENVDFAALSQNLAIAQDMKDAIRPEVATAAGIPESWVHLELSDGSSSAPPTLRRRLSSGGATTVEGTIAQTGNASGVNMSDVHSQLSAVVASGNLTSSVEDAVSGVDGIAAVSTGTISVSVAAPVLGAAPTSSAKNSTNATGEEFVLLGNGWCLDMYGARIDPELAWTQTTLGPDSGAESCEAQCRSDVFCIGYMTEEVAGGGATCGLVLITDTFGQGSISGHDPSESHSCWQKSQAVNLYAVQFVYDAPYNDTDLAQFQALFLEAVGAAGFDTSGLSVRLRPGSIIAAVVGDAGLTQALQNVDPSLLAVMGYVPTLLIVGPGIRGAVVDEAGLAAGEVVLIIFLLVCFVLLVAVILRRFQARRAEDRAPLAGAGDDPEAPKAPPSEAPPPVPPPPPAPPATRPPPVTPEIAEERLKYFHIDFEREAGGIETLGLGLQRHRDTLIVRAVREGGLVALWNRAREEEGLWNRAREVRLGDRIVQVNDTCGSALELERALQEDKHLLLRIRRPSRAEAAAEEEDDLPLSGSEPEVLRDASRTPSAAGSTIVDVDNGAPGDVSLLRGNAKGAKMPRNMKIVPAKQAKNKKPVISVLSKGPSADSGGSDSSPTWTL
jgi:hypothetical protein